MHRVHGFTGSVHGVHGFTGGSWVHGFGTVGALSRTVGARSFDELDAWRLANQLKLGVYALIATGAVTRDLRFCDQLRSAAASAPGNIAEGFGRYEPAEFRRFLRIANGSLVETSCHLRDGVDRKHFASSDIDDLLRLAKRASAATVALMHYLKTAKLPSRRRSNS